MAEARVGPNGLVAVIPVSAAIPLLVIGVALGVGAVILVWQGLPSSFMEGRLVGSEELKREKRRALSAIFAALMVCVAAELMTVGVLGLVIRRHLSHDASYLLSNILSVTVVPLAVLPFVFVVDRRRRQRVERRELTGVDVREMTESVHLLLTVDVAFDQTRKVLSGFRRPYGTDVEADAIGRRLRCSVSSAFARQVLVADVLPESGGSRIVLKTWPLSESTVFDYGAGARLLSRVSRQLVNPTESFQPTPTHPHMEF